VALTALAPPGSWTNSGAVNVYWQPTASAGSSAGEADATMVPPLMALARIAAITADADSERRTVITAV
jgi:hypothetical protein